MASWVALACTAQQGAGANTSPGVAGLPAHAEATDGQFQLTFKMPTTSWLASEAIEGTSTLSVGAPIEVGGSGDGLLGFNYDEVGGLGRHIGWAERADCGAYQLEPNQPLSSGLKKAGGYDPEAPGADFYASFFADPFVHLPAGTWTITALASFIGFAKDQGCQLPSHELSAPITIHITP